MSEMKSSCHGPCHIQWAISIAHLFRPTNCFIGPLGALGLGHQNCWPEQKIKEIVIEVELNYLFLIFYIYYIEQCIYKKKNEIIFKIHNVKYIVKNKREKEKRK